VVAPICPQFGQTIRVSMNVTTAAAGAAVERQDLRQQVRQHVGDDAPGLHRGNS
jgi:hypothetical protein